MTVTSGIYGDHAGNHDEYANDLYRASYNLRQCINLRCLALHFRVAIDAFSPELRSC